MAGRQGVLEQENLSGQGMIFNMDSVPVLDCDIFDLANQVLDMFPEAIPIEDFGSYHILGPLGAGGMGEVYLAEDRAVGRRVAIKFLGNIGFEPDLRAHFTRETQMLARLEHPHIARLYEIGLHPNGTPYSVLEYVEGKPLDEYCREHGSSLETRLRLFRLICGAVQYAHSRAVVHLDLKPSNILVKDDGSPTLLDFGIARHLEDADRPVTQTQVRCTPAYAAPEQIRRQPVGTYTDVYALGVILYELLAQTHPYPIDACSPSEVEALIAGEQEPRKPSDSPTRVNATKAAWNDLDVLCLKAVKKDIRERYHSVVELSQDVDRFLRSEPLQARPDKLGYRVSKFLRRHRGPVLASATVLILVAALVAFYTVRLAKARDAALAEASRSQRIEKFTLGLFGGDANAAPSSDLRVVDILDKGLQKAQSLNGDPSFHADLYQTLGGIYHSLGQFDRADSLLQSALEARKSIFGPDSPRVADTLLALGILRTDQARFAEAERLIRQAVAIDRRHFSADAPELGDVLSSLGATLEKRGAFTEAIQVLDEAIRIQSMPNADKAELVDSLTYLANVHHSLGHDSLAEPLDQRVLTLDRQIYGDKHPSVAEDYMNLGEVQKQIGMYAEAERNERLGIQITQAWYGNGSYELSIDREGLAETLIHEQAYDEAARLLDEALTIQERVVGKAHPYVAFALNLRGVIALKRGKLNEAEADFRRMADIYRAAFGDRDRHVAHSLLRFGELYVARNDYTRAEQCFRQSIQIYTENLAADSFQTGRARVELGDVLLRERRYPEAEAELLAGYRIVTPGRKPSLEAAVNARRDLVSLYEALHVPEKAARFRGEPATSQ